jgi:DNA-binding transcriptional regulator YiaG
MLPSSKEDRIMKKAILQEALTRVQRHRTLPSPAKLRLLRVAAGLSQAEIADSLGTTAASVSRYETGDREPRGQIRDKYIEACEELASVNTKST